MNSEFRRLFIHVYEKAVWSLGEGQKDAVRALEPIIYTTRELDPGGKELVVLRWYPQGADIQVEFPILPSFDMFMNHLAANPWSANVWFLGKKSEYQQFRSESLLNVFALWVSDQWLKSEDPYLVHGEILNLRFTFELIFPVKNGRPQHPETWLK